MSRFSRLLDQVTDAAREFTVLEVLELLVIVRNELERRDSRDAAVLVWRAARVFAEGVSGPDAPSDNGNAAPGDNEADR